jgi:hypothetical protein
MAGEAFRKASPAMRMRAGSMSGILRFATPEGNHFMFQVAHTLSPADKDNTARATDREVMAFRKPAAIRVADCT